MLNKGDWMEIKAQIDKGVYQKDIARKLGIPPNSPLKKSAKTSSVLFS